MSATPETDYETESEIDEEEEQRRRYYENNETDLYYAMKEGQQDYDEYHNDDDETYYDEELKAIVTIPYKVMEERRLKIEKEETVRCLVKKTVLPKELKHLITQWL